MSTNVLDLNVRKNAWFLLKTNRTVLAKYVNSSPVLHPVTVAYFSTITPVFSLQVLIDGVRIRVLEAFVIFATFFFLKCYLRCVFTMKC